MASHGRRPRQTAAIPDHRRIRVAGGTYFSTVNLRDRGSDLLVALIDTLRHAVRVAHARALFHIDAWVVLPEHMRGIWTLPPGDHDFSSRWAVVRGSFSKPVPLGEHRSSVRLNRRERGIWQRRFWKHAVRDNADYARHMDYVHCNPVKHGYAARPAAWPFRRCVAAELSRRSEQLRRSGWRVG